MTASLPPAAEAMWLPDGYGQNTRTLLSWADVAQRLAEAPRYWLATVRPDGRPHAVPLDGNWLDDAWWFGGSPETVKHRNLLENPEAVLHLDDAVRAVIVEGGCEIVTPDEERAELLSRLSNEKYGYGPPPAVYRNGVWRLTPRRVLAWNEFPRDATRFVF